MNVTMMRTLVLAALIFDAASARAQSGVRAVEYGKVLNDGKKTKLVGFADLHTHPVNHLSFGGKLFHGAPGLDVWMPKAMRGCKSPAGRAATREEALGDCSPIHKFVATGCGNVWRGLGAWALEMENDAQHAHGEPQRGKKTWPAHDDITHQQMWHEWTERAYKGGLRVMVALVTNNKMLGDGVRGENTDDRRTIELAIPETKRWVSKIPWMEVAYSPQDVRRIVGKDKLAVILGTEVDDIGDMVADARNGVRASDARVREKIRELHRMGVRYIFPIHVVDNLFGGTAAYRSAFDLANRYLAGFYWALECATGYVFQHDVKAMPKVAAALSLSMDLSERALEGSCAAGQGHINRRGLTRRGAIAIDEMMRLGMLVDIDHMSHATIRDTIAIARAFHGGYPLVSGHSSLLDRSDDKSIDKEQYGLREDKKRAEHYRAIRELGGIVGIEWDTTSSIANAKLWTTEVGRVMTYAGTAIALGTDINGMVIQPRKPDAPVVDYTKLPKSKFDPSKPDSREWDYNVDGMVHYGMLTDFLIDVQKVGNVSVQPLLVQGDRAPLAPGARSSIAGPDVLDALYNGAEAFAQTWERAKAKGDLARRAPAEKLPADVREVPSTVVGPLCPTEHTGGREFGGHGPRFSADVKLRIVDARTASTMKLAPGAVVGASAIVANVDFLAEQTKLGRTRAKQAWDVVVANAPRGMRFERILGPASATRSTVRGVSAKGGFQFIVVKNVQPAMWLTPDSGDAVDEFLVVGDTGGLDISDDEDCRDDTSVTAVLNPIRAKVAPIADRTVDSLLVKVDTGADDVRGGPASITIHYAGGHSAAVDITSIAKKKNQGGTIRVPLGKSVKISELRSLEVRHVSNKCFACKTDRWIVSSIVASADGVGPILVVSRFELANTTKRFGFP